MEIGFRIPIISGIPDSLTVFRNTKPRIQDSTSKTFLYSGFCKQNLLRFQNLDFLTWGEKRSRNVGSLGHPLQTLKTLNPKTDQHQFSPNNINVSSKNKVMRINMMITKEKYFDLVSVPCKAAHLGFLH